MSAEKSRSGVFYGKLALVLILMVGIGFLPTFGAITPYGMKILGIFIGCVVGWGMEKFWFWELTEWILD